MFLQFYFVHSHFFKYINWHVFYYFSQDLTLALLYHFFELSCIFLSINCLCVRILIEPFYISVALLVFFWWCCLFTCGTTESNLNDDFFKILTSARMFTKLKTPCKRKFHAIPCPFDSFCRSIAAGVSQSRDCPRRLAESGRLHSADQIRSSSV